MTAIPYYWVNPKNGRAYWRPNKRMQAIGFGCVSLGPAGPDAEQEARVWNLRWQQVRKEDVTALGVRSEGRCGDNFVYFLQIGGRIKIGFTRSPFTRLQTLTGGAAKPFRRAVVVSGTRNDERRLHLRFKFCRTGGEWFAASRSLLLTMARSAAAGEVVHDGDAIRLRARESQNTGTYDRLISGAESNHAL